jgi:hypothetical protein
MVDPKMLEKVFTKVLNKIGEGEDIEDDAVLAPKIKSVLGEMNITASGSYGPKCKMFRAYNKGDEVIVKPAARKSGTKRRAEDSGASASGAGASSSSAPKPPKKARSDKDISELTASLPAPILDG